MTATEEEKTQAIDWLNGKPLQNWREAKQFVSDLMVRFQLSFCFADSVREWKVVPMPVPFRGGINPLFHEFWGEEVTELMELKQARAIRLFADGFQNMMTWNDLFNEYWEKRHAEEARYANERLLKFKR